MSAIPVFTHQQVQWLRQQIIDACAGCKPVVNVRASGAIAIGHDDKCPVAKALGESGTESLAIQRTPGESAHSWAGRIAENARALLGVLP